MPDRTFHIRPVLDGQSLAQALRRLLPDMSWSAVKELIARRHVHLNGNLAVDEGRRLKAGDVLHVFAHARAAPPTDTDVKIRFMDEHLVVIDKPAGITTLRHTDERDWPQKRKDRMPTLDEVVQRLVDRRWREQAAESGAAQSGPTPTARGPKMRAMHPLARTDARRKGQQPSPRGAQRQHPAPGKPGGYAGGPRGKPPRVRPVHRLDRDTSGLMLFALSPQAEQTLEGMFVAHEVDRTYLAVVHGHPAAQTIASHFVRDRGDGLRGSTPRGGGDSEAKHAVTHVAPVEQAGDYSIVEVRLETGRTHQIRIHLAEAGHMLCGEKVYNRPLNGQPTPDRSGAPRQALHSAALRFVHPMTNQQMSFRSDLPADLREWLQDLK